MYAIIQDEAVVKWGAIAALFPNVSFPESGPENDWMASNDVYLVNSKIEFDPATERVENVEPYFEDGTVLSVRVVARSAENLANERHNQITRAIQSGDMTVVSSMTAEEKVTYEPLAWNVTRERRTVKLADTDWTQLDDTPIANTDKSQWALYRQALRDITTQADPFHIEWPALPV
jgi:hypothetical protein